ncbi:HD-GYP domain-containing protein [Anaeromicropila herbilytica]|uniref:C-di-GMP phosphodiesterase n=1 Tax=Anaeromicropila herbilytica TaxID=2785025 RepID=A0A7R7EQ66_9FIRM|nr:HD domain-containing phosphohydrolase [Anaeromicropila herbilytica]BCN33013.1 c-di-GMP phosphodiesterase [Anaeromicropila herbilytica]
MRKVSINTLKGNEKLARNVWSDTGIVLMSEGTYLKKEYIPRLKELNIGYIYIDDDLGKGIKVDEIIEEQIKEQCQNVVKDTIQKYFYNGNNKLEKLKIVAEDIILDMLEQSEVMYNISGVREKSESLYSHSVNVCTLSVLIALRLKLSKKRVQEIAIGSLLHDIGYNYITFNYQDKSIDQFSELERREIKKHVIYGYSAIEKEDWLSPISKDIILSHHENINGEGYPFHLKGDRIKLESKIVAVCDEFDRLVYGTFTKPMKVHETIEYILSQSGIRFDQNVVNVFNKSVAVFPNSSTVITNEGEIGIVLRQNSGFPARPVIRIVKDKDGNNTENWMEKDLTKILNIFIVDTIEI